MEIISVFKWFVVVGREIKGRSRQHRYEEKRKKDKEKINA